MVQIYIPKGEDGDEGAEEEGEGEAVDKGRGCGTP
jgi:hypothetical protein